MKKLFILLISLCTIASVNAKGEKGMKTVEKGTGAIGIMLGVPPTNEDPNMPFLSVDGNWSVASGFIKSKTFGDNGAIDLGFYYGFCHYYKNRNYTDWYTDDQEEFGIMQNTVLFRAAFHFEFVENLDVYAGMAHGFILWSPTGEGWEKYHQDWNTEAKYAGGFFTGAKYYFTDHFGVKMEFAFDWNEGNLPPVAGGVTFRF